MCTLEKLLSLLLKLLLARLLILLRELHRSIGTVAYVKETWEFPLPAGWRAQASWFRR